MIGPVAADGSGDTRLRLQYTNWTNLDAEFMRPYEPGDRIVRGWTGEIEVPVDQPIRSAAEEVFNRHNHPGRPDGQLCPSMSIGDVVVFGEVALSVARRGFVHVSVERADLITNQTWSEAIESVNIKCAAGSVLDAWSASANSPQLPAVPEVELGL